MGYLLSDMAQTMLQISANGYFYVSKKLFPQVKSCTQYLICFLQVVSE
jgi:hypothetical protein